MGEVGISEGFYMISVLSFAFNEKGSRFTETLYNTYCWRRCVIEVVLCMILTLLDQKVVWLIGLPKLFSKSLSSSYPVLSLYMPSIVERHFSTLTRKNAGC
jgi:hypothetical protein